MATHSPARKPSRRRLGSVAASIMLRTLLYGLGWVVLTQNDPEGRPFLFPVVAVLVGASYLLHPPAPTVSVFRLVTLLPLLAWDTVHGGIDVARRAFDPRLPIAPALIDIELDAPTEQLQIALAYVMTVMPGTLAVKVTPRGLIVHVLDRRQPNEALAADLARRLRAVFGEPRAEDR